MTKAQLEYRLMMAHTWHMKGVQNIKLTLETPDGKSHRVGYPLTKYGLRIYRKILKKVLA